MAQPVAVINVSNNISAFEISNISQLDEVLSPTFLVQDIPWNVQVCKKTVEAEEYLAIYLYCAKEDKPPNWQHTAWASVKLLPFSGNQNVFEGHIDPHVFDHTGFGYGTLKFIKWNKLFDVNNNYVKDDTINVDIKIEAEPQDQMNRSELKFETLGKSCSCQIKFRLTVSNINNLITVRSPEFLLCDLPWEVNVYKDHSSNLCVRSQYMDSLNETTRKTKMVVKLLSKKANVKPIEQTQIENILPLQAIETDEYLPWDELFKPEYGFVEYNSITLEVVMKSGIDSGTSDSSDFDHEIKRRKLECAICFKNIDSQNVSCPPCGHLFCTPCITNTVKDQKICPSCKVEVTLDGLRRVHLPFLS